MPPATPPALCLTFDDLHVANWCAAAPLLAEAGARVTFCVCRLGAATPAQLDGLRTLQAAGHEIACHSASHPRLAPYLRRHGLQAWIAREVEADIAAHRAAGFPATAFASPFHQSTPETRAATGARFRVVRARGPLGADPAAPEARFYAAPGPDNVVDCAGTCDLQLPMAPGWPGLRRLLDRLAQAGGTAVLAGHDIRAERAGPGYYATHRQLRRLLAEARARGIGFVTLSEIAGPVPAPPPTPA